MSVGYTPATFGLTIVFGLAGLVAVGLVWRVFRAILRGLGISSDGVALVAFAAIVAALALGASMAVDRFGERASAVVTSRRETVQVTSRGGWRRTYQIGIRAGGAGAGPERIANLSPSPERYDAVIEGDRLGVRVVTAGGLSLVRDERESMATDLPWRWLAAAAAGMLVVALVWRHVAALVVMVVVLGGATLPLIDAYRDWHVAEDVEGMTERATATVREVTRVTEWRFRSRRIPRAGERVWDEFALPQHYDVVALDLTPSGWRGSVLGVDAVDVAEHSPPVVAKGSRVEVRFAPGDPREVRLAGQTRTWHWRDMLAVYRQIWIALAVLGAGLVAWVWLTGRRRAGRRNRHDSA